ncbi:immunity 50 family protein [Enterobacter asburiae]|nr:immunity 50 family protein [Enterobacter asburiae]
MFNEEEPSLYNVDIHDIVFHRDGPCISIRFNLRDYPSSPPKKWRLQKYNTIQYNTIQYNTIQYNTIQCSADAINCY